MLLGIPLKVCCLLVLTFIVQPLNRNVAADSWSYFCF